MDELKLAFLVEGSEARAFALVAARVSEPVALDCRNATAETAIGSTERGIASMRNYRRLGVLPAHKGLTYIAMARVGSLPSDATAIASFCR